MVKECVQMLRFLFWLFSRRFSLTHPLFRSRLQRHMWLLHPFVTSWAFISHFSSSLISKKIFFQLATKCEKLDSGSVVVHNHVYECSSECEAQAGFEEYPTCISVQEEKIEDIIWKTSDSGGVCSGVGWSPVWPNCSNTQNSERKGNLMSWSVFRFPVFVWNRSAKVCSVVNCGVSFDTIFISFRKEIFCCSVVVVFFLSLSTSTEFNLFVFT